MFLTRMKLMGAAALAALLTVTGAGLLAQRGEPGRPAATPPGGGRGDPGRPAADVRGVVRSVDAAQNTLTLAGVPSRDGAGTPDRTFPVAKDAEVVLDDGRGRRFLGRAGKLADVTTGAVVTMRLAEDQKTADSIFAEGPMIQGKLASVDAAKGTVDVASFDRGRDGADAAAIKTYAVSKDAEVVIDDGRGRRTSLHEAKLGDLVSGCLITLKLSVDQKEAISVSAEGGTVQGPIKAVDAAKQIITLTIGPMRREEAAEERTFTVPATADVLVEDLGPRRFFPVREGKLADLPAGAMAFIKLAPDQSTAAIVRVEGPNVGGILRGVDPGKGTVTIVIGGGRGTDGEEKTYAVAKDARVWSEGAESKFADLKVSDPPQPVMLKLSLDQKTAQAVTVGALRR